MEITIELLKQISEVLKEKNQTWKDAWEERVEREKAEKEKNNG